MVDSSQRKLTLMALAIVFLLIVPIAYSLTNGSLTAAISAAFSKDQ